MARNDFPPIAFDLEVIQALSALLLTRKRLVCLTPLATVTTAVLVGVGTKVLPR
jgi:hypothetical protein